MTCAWGAGGTDGWHDPYTGNGFLEPEYLIPGCRIECSSKVRLRPGSEIGEVLRDGRQRGSAVLIGATGVGTSSMTGDALDLLRLPQPGQYAIYRGTEYRAVGHIGRPWITLYMDRATWSSFQFPDEVDRSASDAPFLCVTVRESAVERMFTRGWVATWFGESVSVEPIDTDTARIHYDRDPDLARALGLEGSQNDGSTGTVPYAELTELSVVERELPVRQGSDE